MAKVRIFCICLGLFLVGCSTMKRSLATGAAAGTATGAATGIAVGSATKVKDGGGVVLQSALIGALLGLSSSWFIHGHLEKRDGKVINETLLNLEKFGVDYPKGEPTEGWIIEEKKEGEQNGV